MLEKSTEEASFELSEGRRLSKYEALFAGTAGAREWQVTVVEEACLENSFDLFLSKIEDVVGGLTFDGGVDLEPITAFAASVDKARACNYQFVRVPFGTFFHEVYPAYVKAMSSPHRNYF